MKQTAVEWLENQLLSPEFRLDADYYEFIYELCQQAKAMEKEQMEDIYIGHNQYNDEYETFEEYYNETFKSE